jgi:hypothetical protein
MGAVLVLIVISVFFTYRRAFVTKNFELYTPPDSSDADSSQ